MEPGDRRGGSDPRVVLDALIVSEVRFLRESLAEILHRVPAIRVRAEAATVVDALAVAEAMRPWIVFLDVAFAGGTGTAARLCAAVPGVRLVALGIKETEEDVLAWAEAGVVGYVPNTASGDDLVALVGQISRGEQTCPSHIAGCLMRRIATSAQGGGHAGTVVASLPASQPSVLTCREQEIFRLVGAGLSNKDIARRLSISLGTTKSHVHNLLAKLSLQRRADVMAHLHGHNSPVI